MTQVPIAKIAIGSRSRRDLGDLHGLADSIQAVGLLHPPVVTPDLCLIAGERRLEAMKILGWDKTPVRIAEDLSEALQILRAERDENTCRKGLNPSEAVDQGARIEAVEKPKAEERQREHGRTAPGRPANTGGNLPPVSEPAKVRDKVGPVVGMSGRTYEKAKAVVKAAEDAPEKFAPLVEKMDKTGKVDAAYNALKSDQARERDAELAAKAEAAPDKYLVIHSAIADLPSHVDPQTIDAIVTDPPYKVEYLDVYDALSEVAARVLKPGGSLLAMVGQAHLPEVIQRLSLHLRYHWTIAYMMPGASSKMWGLKLIVGWKPVLWFVNGPTWEAPSGMMATDVAASVARDKDHHEWGQSESGMADLIEKVTKPGGTVLDPFCGGGGTGAPAIRLSRFFVGADKEQDAVNRTTARLAEALR